LHDQLVLLLLWFHCQWRTSNAIILLTHVRRQWTQFHNGYMLIGIAIMFMAFCCIILSFHQHRQDRPDINSFDGMVTIFRSNRYALVMAVGSVMSSLSTFSNSFINEVRVM
jgi:hypothetical protein